MLVPLTMLLATAVSSVHPTFTSSCETDEWSGWGGNNCNNRYVPNNEGINSSSVASLTQHCKLDYPYGVSATPSIVGTQVYFPTWGGLLVSLDYTTCQVAWQINVTQIIADFAPITEIQRLISSPVARTSPVVVKGVLYFGTLTHALLCAANASDGTVHGCKQVS
jgi:outer membrane protein assembly factor BamB